MEDKDRVFNVPGPNAIGLDPGWYGWLQRPSQSDWMTTGPHETEEQARQEVETILRVNPVLF